MELGPQHVVEEGGSAVLLFHWEHGGGGLLVAEETLCHALVRRPGGLLVALPSAAVEEEVLQANSLPVGAEEPLIGPYTGLFVQAVAMTSEGVWEDVEETIGVLVVDMSLPAAAHLFSELPVQDRPGLNPVLFYEWDATVLPALPRLLEQVRSWIAVDQSDRVAFYSAAEEDPAMLQPSTPSRKAPGGITPGEKEKAKPKKQTVATLATQMETISSALPGILDQLTKLSIRQEALEKASSSSKATVRPVAPATPILTSRASMPVSALLGSPTIPLTEVARQLGPPPKTKMSLLPPPPPTAEHRTVKEDEPHALDGELLTPPTSPMAEALLEQSRALAALVAHFQVGSTDPMQELASPTGAMGVKGAVGREKLQRELSMGSGQFFLRVSQSMSRRMSPTSPLPQNEANLEGISMLSYLEKFGGFGQNRSLGLIMWSLAHVYDSAARGQWGAVKDHLALTCVMIDQANQDGGDSWQLPWLLRLLDDPPSNLWMNRNTTATGARRPFAPLVAQSWATVALAFLKETEILNNKKQEVSHPSKTPSVSNDPKAKAKPRRKPWQQKQNADQTPGAQDS